MCGIAGVVRYDRPGSASLPQVREMLRGLRHRGPDDEDARPLAFAALGNARLSFLDREGGRQPMSDASGRWWITYNGEVYNHGELRAQLEGEWTFRTRSDTEAVLAACATWGEAALARLNGMFSFFFWDAAVDSGWAARDRLGVKPFAYVRDGGALAFASEAKVLLAHLPGPPRARYEAVLEYLLAPCFSGVEHAMFDGVHYLPPGHVLRVGRGGVSAHSWWEWTRVQRYDDDFERLAQRLGERLSAAVRRALHGEHPCASFLSGGLDSTLLSAVAARSSDAALRAYTIRFDGQDRFDYRRSLIVRSDDTPHACAAARELGLDHRVVDVRRQTLGEDLERLATINDALPAWEQELAQHHLSRAASALDRAVLVGDAADETHYGYPFLLDPEAVCSPRNILRRFGVAPLRAAAAAVDRLDAHYRALAEEAGFRWGTLFEQVEATTFLIVKRWLPRLLHNGDIHTMALSLEARVPFADTEVIDVARLAHPRLAVGDGEEKRILRAAARGRMPESNRLRPKSALPKDQGAAAVYQREARRAWDESAEFLGTWLDPVALRALTDEEYPLMEHDRSILFRVIALHHWRRAYGVRTP